MLFLFTQNDNMKQLFFSLENDDTKVCGLATNHLAVNWVSQTIFLLWNVSHIFPKDK
jgi:hypothetical protein